MEPLTSTLAFLSRLLMPTVALALAPEMEPPPLRARILPDSAALAARSPEAAETVEFWTMTDSSVVLSEACFTVSPFCPSAMDFCSSALSAEAFPTVTTGTPWEPFRYWSARPKASVTSSVELLMSD